MGHASLQEAVRDLERARDLVEVTTEVDPYLELGVIQRRVLEAGGPALLFTRVRGTKFPMLANLFGSKKRAEFLFRDALAGVRALVAARVDPSALVRSPGAALRLPAAALHLLPRKVRSGPVLAGTCRVSELPQLVSWPEDGGPFVTLPQVYTEDPDEPGIRRSNLGMYRIQLGGNGYVPDREIGLHYQIHRGIGVHHSKADARGQRLPVAIFVGGPPAMTLAAVMPLPEGMPELHFAGALGGRAIRMIPGTNGEPSVHADADFCIRGWVSPGETKPEGPFGDHLGYYSKRHEFPVLHVTSVHHRADAIWPFTTVGRPPQEDTIFGEIIHELTAPLVPEVLPGVEGVHAVDASGVHPLLLAIGSERYGPWAKTQQPMEMLTQANAILGNGQMSLAKYLFICDRGGSPPDLHDVGAFFAHVLARIDPTRDLHFHTNTTMDTLDYSGGSLNLGSKLVVAACGPARRTLGTSVPSLSLPVGYKELRVVFPGALTLAGPGFRAPEELDALGEALLPHAAALAGFPLIVVCDDAEMVARNLSNFLWVTFTRSNPAVDVHGVGAFTRHKAWGCTGPILIDARTKPHHAPPLEMDPKVTARVDAMFARGGPLAGLV